MAKTNETGRQRGRLLAFLLHGEATLESGASTGVTLVKGPRGAIAVAAAVLDEAKRDGLTQETLDGIVLSEAGMQALMQQRAAAEPQAAQHRELEMRRIETAEGWETVPINLAESPLAQIARRRGKDGRAFLSEGEVRSGERLRSDFTRAQLMPRLGANWQASISSGRRGGDRSGIADLTDAALAARQRVERAVEATGPELSGVLIDICCFLKGLEQVEMERGWPVRSAKVMLKAALGALARHYEPDRAPASGRTRIMHWGAEGYRPALR